MTKTTGRILHAAGYDLLVWILTGGRDRQFRERLVELACPQTGDAVLDVGCGTGSLAIAAKRRVGPAGAVCGIDASPAMIARATKKARKQGIEVQFQLALAEALPFPDSYLDVAIDGHAASSRARHPTAVRFGDPTRPETRRTGTDG